jgi:nucleoside 2-deoxyribosyltransferase
MPPLLYLAGPDVFRPDFPHWRGQAEAAVHAAGLKPLLPVDGADPDWRGIAAGNLDALRRCDAVAANILPFRGAGMDAGTAVEIGFAAALGKPVFLYTGDGRDLLERTAYFWGCLGGTLTRDEAGAWRDPEGLLVEDFGLAENLMVHGVAVRPEPWRSLEEAATAAARHLRRAGLRVAGRA